MIAIKKDVHSSEKRRRGALLIIAFVVSVTSSCATFADKNEEIFERSSESVNSRDVVVLIDGTANTDQSKTNIYQMKEALKAGERPVLLDYIPGVGTAKTPLLGMALGFTMEEGILKGYRFISSNARPGDRIMIFGFSRGAHQARSLAGLIAYAGLLDVSDLTAARQLVEANKILEFTKDHNDDDQRAAFVKDPDTPPLMRDIEAHTGNRMRAAQVDFLGVWDTVPGSIFLTYEGCREQVKADGRQRYKTASYPLIRNIVHAVSRDEKRSRYAPLLICPAIVEHRTRISEKWFAGAHADVGGGYPDGLLQTISMAWMADEMGRLLDTRPNVGIAADFDGMAHWSLGDGFASFLSSCMDRNMPGEHSSGNHESVKPRIKAHQGLVMVQEKKTLLPYPLYCEK